MKSKTILGADGATKMRQITVGIHGKGGERRRRAGQKHRLCAAADTAGVRGGLSTHYAAFIYDAVHGR